MLDIVTRDAALSTKTVPLTNAWAANSSWDSIFSAEYALMGGHEFAPQLRARNES